MNLKPNDYTKLIIKIAKPYLIPGIDLQDLIQEGMIGVIRANNTYDPTRGCKFSTYAYYYIKKYILEFLRKEYIHTEYRAPSYYTVEEEKEEVDINKYCDINNQLLSLSLEELNLIYLKFGFGTLRPHTNKEIGEKHNKTEEWARGSIKKILEKLRKNLGGRDENYN